MLKAIFAKHVLSGDIVMLSGGSRITVRLVELIGDSVHLYAVEGGIRVLGEYDIVGLGRRPWPEGMTEADMLEAVEAALRRCAHAQIEIEAYLELWRGTNLGENLRMLREAIEAYELGKPEAKP